MISGRTRLAAVIGWPVEHSLSPVIHRAGFASLGFDATYVALAVEPDRLAEAVAGIRALGLLGVSVTMPHKATVLGMLDEVGPVARRLRSVNTISVRDGRLHGDSTDGAGFLDSLRDASIDVEGRRVLVVGTGGAGRAVVDALVADAGAEVSVTNRSSIDTSLLPRCRIVDWARRDAALAEHDVVVNCTSIGMGDDRSSPVDTASLDSRHVVVDLVYHPSRTTLLDGAAARGARIVGGIGMLVHQAARQELAWTGRLPDVESMRDAALSALAADR